MPKNTSTTSASVNGGNGTQHAWHDREAEQQLLTELIVRPHVLPDVLRIVKPDDLSAAGGNQLQALIEQVQADGRTTGHLLAQHPLVDDPDVARLDQRVATNAPLPYARHLALLGRRRRDAHIGEELQAAARAGDDDALDRWRNELIQSNAAASVSLAPPPVDIDDLLAETDDDYDWLIPGLLERGDRLILTAGEGDGKSTLLRQIGLRGAASQHPFTGDKIDPLRTLIVDCENSRRQVRREIAKIREAADGYNPGHLLIECRPQGIDLLDPADATWLRELIETNKPDLLVIGPLYKMAAGDPIKEEVAREIANFLDHTRAATGITLILEAHRPYADGSKSKRPLRPYGASLWSRWPEFGICLTETGALAHWRGARDQRAWPAALDRSAPWPWAPRDIDDDTVAWNGPTECADAIVDVCAQEAGAELTIRQITDKLKARGGRGYRDQTIRGAAELAVTQGRLTSRLGPRNARMYQHDDPQERLDETF